MRLLSMLLLLALPKIIFAQDTMLYAQVNSIQPENPITGSIELDYNLVQDDDDYLMPTIVLEVSGWHFEGRRNYEEKNSSSLWIGYNFEIGKELKLNIIPLAGVVIGSVAGAAPGLELEMSYDILSLNIQSEYFFNAENIDYSFFYTWNEFGVTPIDWLYAGIVIERTKAYKSDREVQAGLCAGISYSQFYFTTYLFDPNKVDRSMLFALGWEF
jgi:hypothetical protein